MEITRINNLNFEKLMQILESPVMTETQKTEFIKKNYFEIERIMTVKISSLEYKTLMQNRKLQKFRPLKNSFTKKGDKLILAKALNINPSNINSYIKNVFATL